MCCAVCWVVHIKEHLLLFGKSRPYSGGNGFPLSLYEWSFTICPTPYIRIKNALGASLNKTFPSFLSLYEWSFTICPTPYNRIKNALSASLSKTFPSFLPLSLYEWSFTICPTPYIRIKNALSASLNKTFPSFLPLSLYEWSFTICPTPYNCIKNALSASLNKTFPSFLRSFLRARCQTYSNLPAGCTLKKGPGECCAKPDCSAQHVGTGNRLFIYLFCNKNKQTNKQTQNSYYYLFSLNE